MSRLAGAKIKAYFFEDTKTKKRRNTAVFASSAEAAKEKLVRPPADRARVYAVRDTKSGEAAGGKWSRIRADGLPPGKSQHGTGRGYGPPR